jgi:hypothetical protein
MRNSILVGLFAFAVPACLVGSGDITSGGNQPQPPGGNPPGNPGSNNPGGNPDPNPTPTPIVTGSVDKTTVNTELGTTETLTYTVTGTNGFSGAVTVAPSVVDAQGNPVTGWTLTPSAPTVTLSQNGIGTVSVAVMIPTDTAALSPTVKLALTSSAAEADVTSAFTVKQQVTIPIAEGTGATALHTTLPQPNSRMQVRAGTAIVFHNADTVAHRIHGDTGIAHEPDDLAPGADYVVTVTTDGDWWCHDHEQSSAARIVAVTQ